LVFENVNLKSLKRQEAETMNEYHFPELEEASTPPGSLKQDWHDIMEALALMARLIFGG
jgi:hypothetical protein